MTRYIDPDLKDFLRREDSYIEYAVEVTAPDVGQVIRRATDQFFTAPALVSMTPAGSMTQAPAGGLQLVPAAGTLATTAGANTTTYALNQENPATRMKGLVWTVDPAFARAVLRSVQATVVRTGAFKNVPTDFQLQVYRITKTPGAVEKYDSTKKTYSATAFTDYAFTPLLSTAVVKKAANIAWAADVATVNFDLSQFGLALENTPTPAAAADQVGELPLYFFVVSALNPPAQNTFFWQLDTTGQKTVANVGTFTRSWWDRAGSDAQWNRTDYADCPSFTLQIDTYAASAQAVYLIDLGRVPTAGTTGRIVFERKLPTATATTLELSTAGNAGPWAAVKSGDVVATAQQQYWLRLTLNADAAGRSSPVALGWGVEFRTPYDVSDIAITQLPTRDVAPPDCKASIAEATVRLIREGQRDFLDLASVLGSTTPASKLEVDVYLRSRHPLIFGDRSKWLRLERLTVDDRDPGKTSEAFTLLSIAKKLKVKVPAKVESVNTVHTVQAGTTATAVQVTPVLVGTSATGHEYNGLGYYLRVRTSAALPAGFSPTIAGSSGTNELDFVAGAFPVALNAGDVVEVHSGLLTTSPLKWQDADPADVWSDILTAAGFPPERIGSADLPRSGYPPRVTDFAPGDATTQAKRKVTMQLTDAESADELLDQISFIMGGATVERNGQICFVQIYPGRALDGTVTVPVAPVAAVFDARDLVAGSLRTKPMVASRKATVTATYGVNKAAANPDAYPERVTNATDADAVEWLTQQDLETVGSMDLDAKITRWFYNTADAGLFLASAVTSQVVRACSTGIRNFPFRVREPYPEVTIGDSVVVITDQYTDYDPSLAAAIAGTVALKGVVVHTAAGGREFSIFVLGLSDNVQRMAGGAAGDVSATDSAPALPTVGVTFDSAGHPVVTLTGAPGTQSMKVAASTAGTPLDSDVEATTAIAGDAGSLTLSGLTVPAGGTLYFKAFAYSRASGAGARSEPNAATASRGNVAAPSQQIIPSISSDQVDDTTNPVTLTLGSSNLPPTYTWQLLTGYSAAHCTTVVASGSNSATPLSGSPTQSVTPAVKLPKWYVLAVTAGGETYYSRPIVVNALFSFFTGAGVPKRGYAYDDGFYAPRAVDTGGLNLHVGVTDSSGRTVAGMFHKPTDTFGAIPDDTAPGGYYKTNQNQRDGGGRAYAGLSGAGRVVTGLDGGADVVGIAAATLASGASTSLFRETFDTDPVASGRWTVSGGSAPTLATQSGIVGPNAASTTGASNLIFAKQIPYNAGKLHRIRARVRQYADGATQGQMYVGIVGYLATGAVANNNAGAVYVCVSGANLHAADGWVEYTGWFKGASVASTTASSPSSNPAAPAALNTGTVSISPYILLNNATGNATQLVDYVEIDVLDEDASARTYGALDTNARLVDQRRVPMTRIGNVGSSQGGASPLSVSWNGTQWVANVVAHTLTVGGASISYNSGSVPLDTGLSANYYIFADDPTYSGGSVAYQKTQSPATVVGAEGRYYVGSVTSGTSGGGGSPPPPTGGGGSGGSCFPGETLVAMASGRTIPIADVQVDDYVLAFDAIARMLIPARVVARHVHEVTQLLRIEADDGAVVETTAEHPFLVPGGLWDAAGELEPGAIVFRHGARDPRGLCATHIRTVEGIIRPSRVYNLTVEGWHTYVAGGFAVHNQKMV